MHMYHLTEYDLGRVSIYDSMINSLENPFSIQNCHGNESEGLVETMREINGEIICVAFDQKT